MSARDCDCAADFVSAAADAGTIARSPCDNIAVGNRDRPAGAAVAAADTRAAIAARRSHGATRNRNGAAVTVDAAANSRADTTACCIDRATGNGNVAASRRAAAADTRAAIAASGRHLATSNPDDAAGLRSAAADASAAAGKTDSLANGRHNSAGNGDRAKTAVFRRPYAGPIVSAVCLDGAALDFQAAGRRTGRAADAWRIRAAGRVDNASAVAYRQGPDTVCVDCRKAHGAVEVVRAREHQHRARVGIVLEGRSVHVAACVDGEVGHDDRTRCMCIDAELAGRVVAGDDVCPALLLEPDIAG